MKKIIALTMILSVLMLVFTACRDKSNPTGNPEHKNESSSPSYKEKDGRNEGNADVEYDDIPDTNSATSKTKVDDKREIIMLPPSPSSNTLSSGAAAGNSSSSSQGASTGSNTNNSSSSSGSSSNVQVGNGDETYSIIINDNGTKVRIAEIGTDVKAYNDLHFDGDNSTNDFIFTFRTGSDIMTAVRVYGYVSATKILSSPTTFLSAKVRLVSATATSFKVYLTPYDYELGEVTGSEFEVGTMNYIKETEEYSLWFEKNSGVSDAQFQRHVTQY